MSLVYLGRLILLAVTVALLALAIFGYLNRTFRIPGTRAFIALCLLSALYTGAFAFELGQETVEGFFLATRLEYLGVGFIPPVWLMLVLAFTGRGHRVGTPLRLILYAWSLIIIALVWTNNAHHLYYRDIQLSDQPGLARFVPGDAYPLGMLGFIGMLLTGLFFLQGLHGPRQRVRLQRIVLALATAFPLSGAVLYSLGVHPGGLDLIPFTLVPGVAVFGIGLFRNRLLSLVPIAREQVIESMSDAVLVIDLQDRILDFNPAARAMFPALGEQAIGQVCHEADSPCLELGRALARTEHSVDDFRLAGADGERWFQFTRTAVVDAKGTHLGNTIVVKDRTDQINLVRRVGELSSHDQLTGLYNRQRFSEIAEAEIRRAVRFGHRLCLLAVELRQLRRTNAAQGYAAGDQLLHDTARRLSGGIRSADILGRTGAAEFAVLLPDTDIDTAKSTAERLSRLLADSPAQTGAPAKSAEAGFGLTELHAADLPIGRESELDPRVILERLLGEAGEAGRQADNEVRIRIHGFG
jgi:diguanylate cyclase (GGDEF)-like protein/PAS domain S-box-containing protein